MRRIVANPCKNVLHQKYSDWTVSMVKHHTCVRKTQGEKFTYSLRIFSRLEKIKSAVDKLMLCVSICSGLHGHRGRGGGHLPAGGVWVGPRGRSQQGHVGHGGRASGGPGRHSTHGKQLSSVRCRCSYHQSVKFSLSRSSGKWSINPKNIWIDYRLQKIGIWSEFGLILMCKAPSQNDLEC